MEEKPKTIYCGSGSTKEGQFGPFESISICLDDIPIEHITNHKNGKRYVNITVSKKKEVDQYGKDLSVSVNVKSKDYTGNAQAPKAMNQAPVNTFSTSNSSGDDLPF